VRLHRLHWLRASTAGGNNSGSLKRTDPVVVVLFLSNHRSKEDGMDLTRRTSALMCLTRAELQWWSAGA